MGKMIYLSDVIEVVMVLPDYDEKSLVNLMSSVVRGLGAESPYNTLPQLDVEGFEEAENVMLLILDGIGYEYLKEKGKDTVLYEDLNGKLTSVFPSSTASAIPTLYTGLAPQQHAVTGWYTFLKELGVVSTILPFTPRFCDEPLEKFDVDIGSILSNDSLMDEVAVERYNLTMKKLKGSQFNRFFGRGFEQIGQSSLKEMFQVLERTVRSGNERKFIRAYWNGFDGAAHEEGVESFPVSQIFLDIDLKLRDFIERMKGTETRLIVTADHGFIDSEEEKAVRLKDHPEFRDCLTLPLCGDHRTIFCYVHPSKTEAFEEYWEDNLKEFCELHESRELVEEDLFGEFEPNPRLYDRIGDYTLIMKDNHILYDTLQNEEEHFMIGNHGGTSKEEMYVPLCVVDL